TASATVSSMLSAKPDSIVSNLSIWEASVLLAGRPLLVIVVIAFLLLIHQSPAPPGATPSFPSCAHTERLQQRPVSPGLPWTHGTRPGAGGPARTMKLLELR